MRSDPAPASLNEVVLGRYLALQRPSLCPEIALWLVHGEVDLNARCAELLEGGYAPYWAFCWSAGQALARFLLDHPEEVREKRVIDLGAGSGITAIAAAKCGAREVIAVDIDPRALSFCLRNAKANDVSIQVASELSDQWDVLLASDVIYEVSMRELLLEQARSGRSVIVGAPHRMDNPKFEDGYEIARYEARCLPDVDAPVREASIYRLSRAHLPSGLTTRPMNRSTPVG